MRKLTALILAIGCGGGARNESADAAPMTIGSVGASSQSAGTAGSDDTSATSSGIKLDVQGETGGMSECEAPDVEGGEVVDCTDEAPPDSFDPVVQWSWTPATTDLYSGVSPLVANLTDDNGDGAIDLCDVPDVLVVSGPGDDVEPDQGHIYVLDGATGTEHFSIATQMAGYHTPAIGDIDGDGIPEIVAIDVDGRVMMFEHDGTGPTWTWSDASPVYQRSALAIANIDGVGGPEILAANHVIDANGSTVFSAPDGYDFGYATPTAADLDGDGLLEVILARSAYRADGSQYYLVDTLPANGLPAVGDVDDDGEAEIVVTNEFGFTIIEHDGTVQAGNQDLRPTGDPADHFFAWQRPVAIHDFDGDMGAEFSLSSRAHYSVYEVAPIEILWTADVLDASGIAGGTAFDFLGDGHADAMYADETQMHVFDGLGAPLMQVAHASATYIEYPVVADVDNDGSAEIVVVSNEYGGGGHPTVQVIRDVEDRWIQARRIWNQHTYHVSNVREDGVIPVAEPQHWTLLNTFRTQAQIEGGGVCNPPPG